MNLATKALPGLAKGALSSLGNFAADKTLEAGQSGGLTNPHGIDGGLIIPNSKIQQPLPIGKLLSEKQKRDIPTALQSGGDLKMKPTKRQSGGFLGTLLASISVPILLKALTGNGMQNRKPRGRGLQNRSSSGGPDKEVQVKKGPAGPPGPKGEKGDAGPAGPAGSKGDTGPQGPACSKGDTGPQGPAGSKGDTGPQGPAGSKGDTGPQVSAGPAGPAGPSGSKGETGPAGSQGTRGPAGPQGSKGDTSSQGPRGPEGSQGPRGPAGSEGSNVDLSNYLDRTKGGDLQKALKFVSSHGADRQISGLSDQPLNGTAAVNLNKLNTELGKKADTSVVLNGLSAKLDITTFNTQIATKPNTTSVLLLDRSQKMTGNLDLNGNDVINSKRENYLGMTTAQQSTYENSNTLVSRYEAGSIKRHLQAYLDITTLSNVNQPYVDNVKKTVSSFRNIVNKQILDARKRKIINLPDTFSDNDEAVSKKYVDQTVKTVESLAQTKVNKSGDTMTGNLNLGNNKEINSAAPNSGGDLCNKTYVDTLVGTTKTNLEKHVNDHLAHSIRTTNLKNDLDYIMNGVIGDEFSDEDDITGKVQVSKDFHKFNKSTKPFDLLLDT
ncbi:Collagen alpha-1(VI) chain [Stylophora pistillata]|uniref:Collagen alpha-1(VI) chain n=1 Tax=Stylophora pistillata TaxID=50429 RepID=A0A2B4RYJ0_STYPI|nr:Collagen alpha-1(VI) chain [Stylophora pistillata]